MSEARLLRLRGLIGWLTMALCLSAVLCLVDSFVDSFHTGPTTFSMLAGGQENLTGPMPKDAEKAEDLHFAVSRPDVRLTITTETQGFWFGNRMWRCSVQAAPDAAPGSAIVTLRGPDDPADKPAQTFTLHIFSDQRALDAASFSRVRRLSGLSPMPLAGVCVLLALAPGTWVFFLSRRIETLRAREGRAEIYKLTRTPDGLHVTFGLGSSHGLTVGELMTVRDKTGAAVARAKVVRCASAEADALLLDQGQAACGDIISRG